MAILWLILALVAGVGAWFGVARMAARDWPALAAGLALLLVAAGLCAMIGEGKTGGFMAGIVGALCAVLMLVAAGALVLAAVLRRLYEWWHPPAGPGPAARGWPGVLGLGALGALAVLTSALE